MTDPWDARHPLLRLTAQPPEPGRLWIAYAPRRWPGPAGAWTDFAGARLGSAGPPVDSRELAPDALDDVVYLPPLARGEGQDHRATLAAACRDQGAPVLEQLFPGEAPATEGAVAAYDLLPELLEGRVDRLAEVEAGSSAVWPLIAGVTDGDELWTRGLERLARSGVRCVQPMALSLDPGARRRLAESRGENTFAALFHGSAPSEREFSRTAHRFGLAPFLERPLPRRPRPLPGNRRLAGALLEIGELWMRLGRPVGRGQLFFRGARWVDRCGRDVEALAREGNLAIVDELDAGCREILATLVVDRSAPLLDELRHEYLEG